MKFEKRNFLNKKSKAQQLVEFLLVAPFLVIFFGILTEYAYALNVSLVLQNGVKTVSANMYAKIKPSMSESEIKQELLSELSAYMTANNAPNKAANGLSVDYMEVGNSAVILAGYKYVCAFTLPTIYFHILPEEFNFKASALVPVAFVRSSNYSNISSSQLDRFWSSAADFSSMDSFNDAKRGIMANSASSSNSETKSIVFLLPYSSSLGESQNTFKIFWWDGQETFYVANLSDGALYSCPSSESCSMLSSNFLNTLLQANIYNLIIYRDFTPADFENMTDLWLTGSGPVADKGVDGILKLALAMYDENSELSSGNYDNIDVSSYNTSATAGMKYKVDYFGSMSIVHISSDSLSNSVGGSPPDEDFDFGE